MDGEAETEKPSHHQTSRSPSSDRKPEEEKHDPGRFAKHFKTQLCHNFCAHGVCKYNQKCLFAHGDDDVRSVPQNVAEGLVSDKSIRTYQRQKPGPKTAAKSQEEARSPQSSPVTSGSQSTSKQPPGNSGEGDSGEGQNSTGVDSDANDDSLCEEGGEPREDPDADVMKLTYRHNPYASAGQVDKAIAEAQQTATRNNGQAPRV